MLMKRCESSQLFERSFFAAPRAGHPHAAAPRAPQSEARKREQGAPLARAGELPSLGARSREMRCAVVRRHCARRTAHDVRDVWGGGRCGAVARGTAGGSMLLGGSIKSRRGSGCWFRVQELQRLRSFVHVKEEGLQAEPPTRRVSFSVL